MPNRLGDAVSPYLRSHANNPVDWQQWGADAFAEAAARAVPVLISIGYSTCHWCHVMARESFSDPVLAAYLNENFVSIKVDREEHPDVDTSYLAAASAFTDQLGWPLTVFATPAGRAFYAGTYFPPVPTQGLPSFREVLEAMVDAWMNQRDNVEDTADRLATALFEGAPVEAPVGVSDGDVGAALPGDAEFTSIVGDLLEFEDTQYGGFGGAPKFPVAPVIGFLLDRADAGDDRAEQLARRMLAAMAASDVRDAVEGGFFRYATRRDWSEPHYERMLYDNALLLGCYARVGDRVTAEGIGRFLLTTLRLPSGGFASAQDSESTVDGQRVEGGYYALDEGRRAAQSPPALDDKVLTGWNGLAIGALASAGRRLGHPEWITAAVGAAELVAPELVAPELAAAALAAADLAATDLAAAGGLVRARIGDRASGARATLEDFGMLADGLIDLALATGEVRFAVRARELVAASDAGERGFAAPGGPDPVLEANGLVLENDPSEGAYPSGLSSISRAAVRLAQLGVPDFRALAAQTMAQVAPLAAARPISFGSALGVMSLLDRPLRQLLVVSEDPDSELVTVARAWHDREGADAVVVAVTAQQARAFAEAGFELFEGRFVQTGLPTAYLCENFLCRLPVTEPGALRVLLAEDPETRRS